MILRVYLIHYRCHDYPAFEYISIKYILFFSKYTKREGDTNTCLICLYIKTRIPNQPLDIAIWISSSVQYILYIGIYLCKKNFLCSHSTNHSTVEMKNIINIYFLSVYCQFRIFLFSYLFIWLNCCCYSIIKRNIRNVFFPKMPISYFLHNEMIYE